MADERRKFLIDPILPTGEIHLFGGPSGAGKTTLEFQMLNDWQSGRPVFGMPSHPCEWAYLSADRGLETTYATIRRTGVKFDDRHIHSLIEDSRYGSSLLGITNWIDAYMKGGGYLILDGMLSLVGNEMNNYSEVKNLLIDLRRNCRKRGVTVKGLVHTSKMREDSVIMNPRQRIAGSVAWAGFSETVMLIEPTSYKDSTMMDCRTFYILPRNAPEMRFSLMFDSTGRLVEVEESLGATIMDFQLAKLKPGEVFATKTASTWAAEKGLTRRTAERWLTRMEDEGKIEKVDTGRWRRTIRQ